MSFNFPNSPSELQEFEAIPGGITYVFYSGKWNIKPAASGGGGITDAVSDSTTYGRENAAWVRIPTITVASSAPSSPATNDVWIDIS